MISHLDEDKGGQLTVVFCQTTLFGGVSHNHLKTEKSPEKNSLNGPPVSTAGSPTNRTLRCLPGTNQNDFLFSK